MSSLRLIKVRNTIASALLVKQSCDQKRVPDLLLDQVESSQIFDDMRLFLRHLMIMIYAKPPSFLSADAYLDWEERQETKHELVGGEPVSNHGKTNRIARLLGNLRIALIRILPANGPCEPFGSDIKIAIPNGNFRYPDLVIDCTLPRDLDTVFAETPTVIFEILSPSNRWYDRANKIADYQLLTACRHIVIVWSTAARIEVLSRLEDDSWARSADVYEGRDAQLVLPALNIKVPLEDVYRGFADSDLPD